LFCNFVKFYADIQVASGNFCGMKNVTQEEIAQRLGLSRATVSRVLRNVSGPKSSTAARIIEVAREMGYRLPATEHTLSRKGAARQALPVLGMLLCVPEDQTTRAGEVPMRILHGATDAIRERNMFLHLEYIKESDACKIELKNELSETFRQKKLAGILVAGPVPSKMVELLSAERPCVRMNLHDRGIKMDMVGQDDRMAVNDLITLLMKNGHRRIGFYCHTPPAPYALSRFSGYVETLAQEGLEYNPAWSVNLWKSAGADAFQQIQRAIGDGVRAWICEHDDLGYSLIQQLRVAGLRVPQDVSVCGFDHLSVSADAPSLTTIDWPLEDIAAAGVSMLIRRINEPARAQAQLLFSGRLIEGDSVGPVV
jgi:LacI family transcriptional regulator